MEIALTILPNSRELSLSVYLDLLGHCSESAVLNYYVLYLTWSCVEVFGELIVEVEGKDVGNCGHLHGNAIDVSISESCLESYCEIATSDWISPTALAIEDRDLLCILSSSHASTKEDQSCHSVPFCEFCLEAIDIHVLRTHLHS